MPLPAEGGFYLSAREVHTFKIEQTDCSQITLNFVVQSGIDLPKRFTLNLTSERGKREIRWSDDTLWYKRKFIPTGFRLPGQRQWMEVRLTKKPDGALLYRLVHRERKNSKPLNEIECLWPKASE